MSQQNIRQGPGNPTPPTEIKQYIANGTITKGDVLSFYGTTGYTVDQASVTLPPMGVAAESTTTGLWFNVIISGFGTTLTNDGNDVADGDLLYAAASGKCASHASGTDAGTLSGKYFAIALQADTDTNCGAFYVLKRV